jgi:hypothetical protein
MWEFIIEMLLTSWVVACAAVLDAMLLRYEVPEELAGNLTPLLMP